MILKASWFWYSILCLLCFAAYVFASKLGLKQGVPDSTMFYLFIWGSLPVALVLLAVKGFQVEKSPKGILCGTLVGILGGAGQLAMLRALAVPGGKYLSDQHDHRTLSHGHSRAGRSAAA
jgi:drug/metabolite transporter (DMT)-like permease